MSSLRGDECFFLELFSVITFLYYQKSLFFITFKELSKEKKIDANKLNIQDCYQVNNLRDYLQCIMKLSRLPYVPVYKSILSLDRSLIYDHEIFNLTN